MRDMDHETRLMATAALSRALAVPARWLKAEADAGRLPHLKAGSQYLFDEEAVRQELLRRASGSRRSRAADHEGGAAERGDAK